MGDGAREALVYDDHRNAREAVARAGERAARSGKRVAVVFGADWCPDALALDRALRHELVAPIVEPAYEVVRVGVGNRDRNLDLMADFGMRVEDGIPAVAILEPDPIQGDSRLVHAQRDGEFRTARSATVAEIVTYFHRWAPDRKSDPKEETSVEDSSGDKA